MNSLSMVKRVVSGEMKKKQPWRNPGIGGCYFSDICSSNNMSSKTEEESGENQISGSLGGEGKGMGNRGTAIVRENRRSIGARMSVRIYTSQIQSVMKSGGGNHRRLTTKDRITVAKEERSRVEEDSRESSKEVFAGKENRGKKRVGDESGESDSDNSSSRRIKRKLCIEQEMKAVNSQVREDNDTEEIIRSAEMMLRAYKREQIKRKHSSSSGPNKRRKKAESNNMYLQCYRKNDLGGGGVIICDENCNTEHRYPGKSEESTARTCRRSNCKIKSHLPKKRRFMAHRTMPGDDTTENEEEEPEEFYPKEEEEEDPDEDPSEVEDPEYRETGGSGITTPSKEEDENIPEESIGENDDDDSLFILDGLDSEDSVNQEEDLIEDDGESGKTNEDLNTSREMKKREQESLEKEENSAARVEEDSENGGLPSWMDLMYEEPGTWLDDYCVGVNYE